jgi:predicted transcriptional regulator
MKGVERRNGHAGAAMDDWWSDIDNEILTTLAAEGPMEPAEVARRLGVPESSATSLITTLVTEGKVRMCLVEATLIATSLRSHEPVREGTG